MDSLTNALVEYFRTHPLEYETFKNSIETEASKNNFVNDVKTNLDCIFYSDKYCTDSLTNISKLSNKELYQQSLDGDLLAIHQLGVNLLFEYDNEYMNNDTDKLFVGVGLLIISITLPESKNCIIQRFGEDEIDEMLKISSIFELAKYITYHIDRRHAGWAW